MPPLQSDFARGRLLYDIADTGKLDIEGMEGQEIRAKSLRRKEACEKPVFVALADEIEAVGVRLFLTRRALRTQDRAPAGATVLAGDSATASERAPNRIRMGEAMKIDE